MGVFDKKGKIPKKGENEKSKLSALGAIRVPKNLSPNKAPSKATPRQRNLLPSLDSAAYKIPLAAPDGTFFEKF